MAYVKAKAMLELKRDIEAMIVSSNPAVASTTSVAGKSAGLGVQSATNTLHNGAGATAAWTSGAPTTAVTAGTNRTFTEALVKTMCQNIYTNSGQFVEQMVMSPSHKATFSAFTGIAQNRLDVKGKNQGTIVGAADVYVSDFGAISVVPHYLMSGANEVFFLNSDYIDLAFLDGFVTTDLAKTGDSERALITADCALAVRAPSAIGKIDDLTP
jgi:nitrite reductase/ring-hydroxylating ferredoxin subunit